MAQSTSRTDSAGSQRGRPWEGSGAPLSGRAVLLPRLKERDRIASALERAGARVLRAAVTRTVPGEATALEATARRILAGEATWLVLTSARTVEALAPYLLAEAGLATGDQALHQEPGTSGPHNGSVPPHTPITPSLRVAVVGPATARAWTELTGTAPNLVARGSAAALLKEPALAGGPEATPSPTRDPDPGSGIGPHGFPNAAGSHDSDGRARAFSDAPDSPHGAPEAARRVLLPASALADPALAEGLRRAGWEVEQVAAYTTVTAEAHDLPPDLDRTWAAGGVDAVVLTAPSTTRAVLELLGPPPQGTGLVAIGATTAAATRKLGLTVAAVAPSPTPEGVLQATIDVTTLDPTLSTTPPLRSTS
ncbi:uroporphyrinogen-III synthase [Actinomyces oris]|uniref:uroporphyrinogen-III synthase n=1 Tax=Actinomyces TaxID=1654 RepID=UPI00094A05FE|nr:MULTISPECIES: uroporphyrinogen-III synthase [Actinomyces]OLL12141.1 uroporphyrinogen-III synthase [Actinomyces oris]QLF52475.1 uroporphyrinogen-III synthase [Actinomyces sp. oral taxon 169]